MTGDLISREALKKAIENYLEKRQDVIIWETDILNMLDNAPTVEPKLKDDIIEAYNLITDQEFEHSDSFWIVTPKGKKIEFVKKRQQGEWIKYNFKDFGAFGDYDYKCSNCQKVSGGQYNFCSNCGADMRGGLKNDRE